MKNKNVDKIEIEQFQIGYNRYEKLRRLNPNQFKKLYEKNLTSNIPFDILVDQLPQ
jgi:hypothetical protein